MAETGAKTQLIPKLKMRVWRAKTQKWEEIKQGGK